MDITNFKKTVMANCELQISDTDDGFMIFSEDSNTPFFKLVEGKVNVPAAIQLDLTAFTSTQLVLGEFFMALGSLYLFRKNESDANLMMLPAFIEESQERIDKDAILDLLAGGIKFSPDDLRKLQQRTDTNWESQNEKHDK